MKLIELLAPAKDYASAVAAIDYGADAVYIGGARFGARQAAGNSAEEIARVAEYAHRYGVRVHATLNTLLWDNELADAKRQAHELIAAGVDALIVQDMSLRRMNLPVELHASTQVCNRTPEGAKFLADVGFSRVILERALSLDEIRAICQATSAEVECFVHGAICVGYSGRCFLSRSMSERSGNRGACSQPCRQTYDLTNGNGKTFIVSKHLLSVRDLNLSAHIGELLDAGVCSFKIEGRLKDINYIKNIVTYYRQTIDLALAARPDLRRSSVGRSITDFAPDPAKSFSRGDSTFFFEGKANKVSSFNTPKAVGEYLGRVVSCNRHGVVLDRPVELATGDGICFVSPDGVVGSNVNGVNEQKFKPNSMEGIAVDAEVYRNFDRRFNVALEHSRTRRVIAAQAHVEVWAEGVRFTYTDCEGVSASAEQHLALSPADKPASNEGALIRQALRSGDTIFLVEQVTVEGSAWFVPTSVGAGLRREALQRLLEARIVRPMAHRIIPENRAVKYPSKTLTALDNVTNKLAEEFYRDHGVEQIEQGLDLAETTQHQKVMHSSYCLRREVGECLLENPTLKGDLYLEHGAYRYLLQFDCKRCEMSLIDESKTNN